ncbi:hypothetical protein ACMD2_11289, partial [Ananas comosus]
KKKIRFKKMKIMFLLHCLVAAMIVQSSCMLLLQEAVDSTNLTVPVSQPSDRRFGPSIPNIRINEYNRRYDADEITEDVIRARML